MEAKLTKPGKLTSLAASAMLLTMSAAASGQTLLDERLAEPSFAAFYNGIRACLNSTRPDCLTPYLDPAFSFHPWWQDDGVRVPRAEFARFAWRTIPAGAAETLWQSLARLFLRGGLRVLDGGTLFVDERLECRAYELPDAHLLTSCTDARD